MARAKLRMASTITMIVCLFPAGTVDGVGPALAGPPLAPKPGVFPIGCFPGPPADANTLPHWQAIKDANFTVACPVYRYGEQDELTMLRHCARVGLKAVVNVKLLPPSADGPLPDDWQSEVERVVGAYSREPALFGYMLKDEPSAAQFDQLRQVSAEFLRRDSGHPTCINLFPTYATPEQLGTETYVEYLDRYMRTVRPCFLCYDHYALLKDGRDRPDYFLNLELVRRAARQYDTPAWNVILSGFWQYFRTPSEGEMRWQVYTSLAYGIKGIFYFTYWPGREDSVAIVDYDGRPQALYPVVRQLNSEILNLGRTLLELRSTGVYHTGGQIPEGCRRLPSGLAASVAGDAPAVVGFFEGPEQSQYVMLVNRDYRKPLPLCVKFAEDVQGVRRVSEQDGSLRAVPLPQKTIVDTLPPGGGVLLLLDSTAGTTGRRP